VRCTCWKNKPIPKSTKQNCKPSQDPTQAAVKYYTALHAINLLLWNFSSPIVYVILGYAPFEDKEMAKKFLSITY
jgi:hypothetical protein